MSSPRRLELRVLTLVAVLGGALALALWLGSVGRGGSESPSLAPTQAEPTAPEHADRLRPPAAERAGGAEPLDAPVPTERVDGRTSAVTKDEDGQGVIQGSVTLPDGSPAGAGILIVATAGRSECSLARAERIREDPRGGHCALTDRDGTFILLGLRHATDYSLTIGGAGFVGHQRQWITNTKRPPGIYRVMRLFGLTVSITEIGGAPLQLHPGLFGQRAGHGRLKLPGVFPLTGTPASAVLAGIAPDALRGTDVSRRTLLYTSAPDVLELGPITFQANLPGYAPLSLEVRARAVTEGLAQYEAQVHPTAAGFGQLQLALVGWNGPGPPFVGPDGPGATLHLHSLRGVRIAFALGPFEEDRILVDGLPHGTWRCSLGAPGALVNLAHSMTDERELEIGPIPARYVIDLSDTAAMELAIRTADGTVLSGRASLVYASDTNSREGWKSQHFRSAPYRINGLPPGAYRLALRLPFAAGTSVAQPMKVTLRGGECARIELREQ
ncbi:MAG TPA: hypothetical protein QF764_02620 [Planctomycetota bacterium]|nr:hypothetical protein [Planctomycetota bacterium]